MITSFVQADNNKNIRALHYWSHDDVIKWKHFPRYWPFVRGIHRSPVNSPHKGQWRGALMFSLIWAWINAWVNNHEAGDLRRHHAHYDVIVRRRATDNKGPFMRFPCHNVSREYFGLETISQKRSKLLIMNPMIYHHWLFKLLKSGLLN